jgi:hypothetical protein
MSQQTLQSMLMDGVTRFTESSKPAEIIDKHVESMFTEIIKDNFRSYSDMGKLVSQAIKDALPSNVSDLFELTRYNDLIATAMKTQWESSGVTGEMLRRSQAAIDEALKDDIVPEFVNLSDLLNAFIEEHKERATDEQWERPHITIRENENNYSSIKHMHICFDPKPEERSSSSRYLSDNKRSEWELANRISVSVQGKNEQGYDFGDVYSAKLEGAPIGRNFMIYKKWEKLTAALYFGGAKLVIDCDEHDFSYDLYD